MGFERTANWQVYAVDGRRKYLDAEERRRFLLAASQEPGEAHALCALLVYTGCRISEALSLHRDQIDIAASAIIVRTLKRRKITFRRVPLPPSVISMLLSISPSEGPIWPIHRATAWRWIGRVMERARIDGPMACCRGARHGFAMHAAMTKVPPNLIQRWMGHASLSTTAIYLDAVGMDEHEFAKRMWQPSSENE